MATNGVHIELNKNDVRRLLGEFRTMGREVDPNIRQMVGETGIRIQADAKRGARKRYGILRSSIYMDWQGRTRKQISVAQGGKQSLLVFPDASESDRDGLNAIIGSEVHYARKIETLEPYMEPAYEEHSDKLYEAIDKYIKKVTK